MSRRWSAPIISALGALLVLVLVAPELDPASGAIPTKGGVYSACLTKRTGAIRVGNYPRRKCAKGQRLIRWNAKGQPGAQEPRVRSGHRARRARRDRQARPGSRRSH